MAYLQSPSRISITWGLVKSSLPKTTVVESATVICVLTQLIEYLPDMYEAIPHRLGMVTQAYELNMWEIRGIRSSKPTATTLAVQGQPGLSKTGSKGERNSKKIS